MSVTTGHFHTFIPFNQVHINDAFWNPRIQANRVGTLPAIYEYFKKTGRIDAFDLGWKAGQTQRPEPHFFWDSDVAKWVEAASFSLIQNPDPALRTLVDHVVDLICSAQQPDGYVNVYFTIVRPQEKWKDLRGNHELYTAGHLIEAAVAHHQATGSKKFLDAMCRFADLIDETFGATPPKIPGYCGHEEVELALVKLYHATANERYLKLAQYFVDQRGKTPLYFDTEKASGRQTPNGVLEDYRYMQAHKPLREQAEVVGHAVRAVYIYIAMADLAADTHDSLLLAACRRLWNDVTLRKMYVTGGLGSSRNNEGFTESYDLPNLNA